LAEPIRWLAALRVGLIIALRREAIGLDRVHLEALGGAVEIAGPGAEAARCGARRLLDRGARLLLSWGTAGALADFAPGTLLLPRSVCGDAGLELCLNVDAGAILARRFYGIAPLQTGLLCSVARPLTAVAEKRALQARTGATAIDMETHAIAMEAAAAGVEMAAVRVVVDGRDMIVPEAALAALDGPALRIDRLLLSLLRRPGQLRALLELARASRRADTVLRGCAKRLPALLGDLDLPACSA